MIRLLSGVVGAFVVAIAGAGCLALSQSASTPHKPSSPPVDFQRQIRPILSDNCFLCHGPDKGTRMADLRLDIKEGALATRKNGTVIVPGKPDESLLVKRTSSDNPAFRMPPVFSHKTLTPAQKDTLRRWVAEGAQWKEHWAFAPPAKAPFPEVKQAAWSANPIDRFLLAKIEANGLTPAAEADRRVLIRRVTLDLTGLPPTPKEVRAFLDDKSPTAYDKLVDRLLASPHYGEHRGRYWLDAARYADSQGLHIDNYREMWPYRDWVINAFNRNLPFDRFTVQQLAGDLLPNATLDDRIASGFHRCNVTTNEGGAIVDEVAAIYAKDRADTTGAVWMGLTVGCATCHDHKFDPISQKDFYSLTSFFRNTVQWPLDGNISDTPPSLVVPQGADRPRWELIGNERAEILKFIADAEAHPSPAQAAWAAQPVTDKTKVLGEQAVFSAPAEETSPLSPGVTFGAGPAENTRAFHFDKTGALGYPSAPEFASDRPFTVSAWVYVPKKRENYVVASQTEVHKGEKPADTKRQGWTLDLAAGNIGQEVIAPGLRIFNFDGKYIGARPGPEFALKPETWYHIAYTYDGSRSRKGISLFVNGAFVPTYGSGEDFFPLAGTFRITAPIHLGGNVEKPGYPDGAVADFRVFDRTADESDSKLLYLALTLDHALTKAPDARSDKEREALSVLYTYRFDPAAREKVARLHTVDAERYTIAHRSPITFVMQERTDTQPVAHVLNRGQYDQPKDEVHPKVPGVLPQIPPSDPQNRLGLAKWLVNANNPLTARVTVNRFWQEVFGTGLVKTAEDFGSQGEPPSHPELLDWLAVDFRESGWDVKRLMRMMVTSSAYRQSAAATPEKIAKDPDNRLMARGPRFRMDAEMVRDYALAVSGLLQPTVGGPSVKPYQPPGIWEAVAMEQSNTRTYQRDNGIALYRRSMYTFWKRSAPPASMDIMNAPSRETCTVRRERTNTPLQALLTMNDPQFVEAARVLAENALMSSKRNFNAQIDFIAQRLISRPLDAKEFGVVQNSYKDFLNFYDSKPADAAKLLKVGDAPVNERVSKPELAAMTMVANEMFNLDEVLVK